MDLRLALMGNGVLWMRKLSQRTLVAILALSLGSVADAQAPKAPYVGQQPVASFGQLPAARTALPYQIRLAGAAIPLTDATLLLYRTIVDGEKSGSNVLMQDVQNALTLNAELSTALLLHMKSTIAEIDGYRRSEIATFVCAKRLELVNQERLADALIKINLRADEFRHRAVSTAEVVLGAASKRHLDTYIDKFRSGMVWLKTDPRLYVQYNIERGTSVAGVIAKMCDK